MSSKPRRPVGVTLLAGAFLWIGCLGTLFFPIFVISGLAGMMWNQSAAGLDQSAPLLRLIVHYGKYAFLVLWFLAYLTYACIGYGLWKLRNGARRALVGLSVFFAVVGPLTAPFLVRPRVFIFTKIIGTALPFAWLTWYLKRPRVRFAFRAGQSGQLGSVDSEIPEGMSRRGRAWTGSAIVATFALFALCVMFPVEGIFRESEIYKITLSEAGQSACVANLIGIPFKAGWMITGGMEQAGAKGSAKLHIPVRGPIGEGKIAVSATEQDGTWKIDHLVLKQRGKEIQLLPLSTTSCP